MHETYDKLIGRQPPWALCAYGSGRAARPRPSARRHLESLRWAHSWRRLGAGVPRAVPGASRHCQGGLWCGRSSTFAPSWPSLPRGDGAVAGPSRWHRYVRQNRSRQSLRLFVVLGGLTLTGLDKTIETLLVDVSPAWLTALTTRF